MVGPFCFSVLGAMTLSVASFTLLGRAESLMQNRLTRSLFFCSQNRGCIEKKYQMVRMCRAKESEIQGALRGGFLSTSRDEKFADLAFPSAYRSADGTPRGFCNWLVPGQIMAGRYPHGTPWGSKTGSPTPQESRVHLDQLITAGVDTFVCLQAEVPAQDAQVEWPESGIIPHLSAAQGFRRYLPDAVAAASDAKRATPRFLRFPIPDFGVPDMAALLPLVASLAADVRRGAAVPYLHCWGGRGRAGTIGACLLLALRIGPDAAAAAAAAAPSALAAGDALGFVAAEEAAEAAEAALRTVQAGYNTRVGEDGGGSLSPETDGQRDFVRRFARVLIAARPAAPPPAA